MKKLNNILSTFKTLTSSQKLDIIEKLKLEIIDETKILSQRQLVVIDKCSNCDSENIIKFGQYNGKNRYKCKDCSKTFSDFTGTSVSYIKKKNLWLKSLELMLENKSIREMSKILEVSTKTIFEWRHKILISLENIFTRDFKGIVEMDDIYLNFNQKGRKLGRILFDRNLRGISNQKTNVMVMSDRYGTLDMRVTTLGRMSVEDLERVIDVRRLNDDNIICSDSHRSIKSYVRELGLKHKRINVNNGEHVVEGIYHVQKVNSLTREFKDWLKLNFNNVSTKYLQNYLFWFKMEKVLKGDVEGLDNFLKYTLKDEETIRRKCNIENDYQDFLVQSL